MAERVRVQARTPDGKGFELSVSSHLLQQALDQSVEVADRSAEERRPLTRGYAPLASDEEGGQPGGLVSRDELEKVRAERDQLRRQVSSALRRQVSSLSAGSPASGDDDEQDSDGIAAAADDAPADPNAAAKALAATKATIKKEQIRWKENPANFHQASCVYLLGGADGERRSTFPRPENVSRFTNEQMEDAWEAASDSIS